MQHETNLRALRLRHGLQLTELSEVSWLSDQYISRAELGQIAPTALLESQMADAVERAILYRATVVQNLSRDFRRCRGRLLEKVVEQHE